MPMFVSSLSPAQSIEVQRIQCLPKQEQDKEVRELLSKTYNPNARHTIRCIFWL